MKSHFLESLETLELQAQQRPLMLKEVFEILGDRSHLVIILFLASPFLQPIPLPGLSTVFGLTMIVIAYLNYFGRPIRVPHRYSEKILSQSLIINIARVAEKIWNFLEKFLRVRGAIFFETKFFKGFNALVLSLQAFLLCLPLPVPFSNTIPAIIIAINVIGELEEDGLVVFLSYLLCLGSFAFFWGLGLGAISGWNFIMLHHL